MIKYYFMEVPYEKATIGPAAGICDAAPRV